MWVSPSKHRKRLNTMDIFITTFFSAISCNSFTTYHHLEHLRSWLISDKVVGTSTRMWDETIASHSGFFVSNRTRTIINLLIKGLDRVVLTASADLHRWICVSQKSFKVFLDVDMHIIIFHWLQLITNG